MSIETVITNRNTSFSFPQYITVKYRCDESVPAHSTSSDLMAFVIVSNKPSYMSHLNIPYVDLTGECYQLDLSSISIACSSADYDFKLLTKNDIAEIDSTYNVIAYSSINESVAEIFERFIISNEDSPVSSYLYGFIINNDGTDTGPIYLELTYVCLKKG
jgi:hypothetical protein